MRYKQSPSILDPEPCTSEKRSPWSKHICVYELQSSPALAVAIQYKGSFDFCDSLVWRMKFSNNFNYELDKPLYYSACLSSLSGLSYSSLSCQYLCKTKAGTTLLDEHEADVCWVVVLELHVFHLIPSSKIWKPLSVIIRKMFDFHTILEIMCLSTVLLAHYII